MTNTAVSFDGIVNVLKPSGMTSHDVVAHCRRVFKMRRVGHTGTLDPGAAGVLPICLGYATRLAEYVQDMSKTYRAELALGMTTTTLDAAGEPENIVDDFSITRDALLGVMQQFTGEIDQIPPMTSALKHRGRRLYDYQREGIDIARKARRIHIYGLDLVRVIPDDAPLTFGSKVLFDVRCSKGTYVRTLCADIGHRLAVGGHLSYLIRTSVGPFDIRHAVTLEELDEATPHDRLLQFVGSPSLAVAAMDKLKVPEDVVVRLSQGQRVPIDAVAFSKDVSGEVAFFTPDDVLFAVGTVEKAMRTEVFRATKVLIQPIGSS